MHVMLIYKHKKGRSHLYYTTYTNFMKYITYIIPGEKKSKIK